MTNYTKLTPFKMCVLENFPFIEADFDALTNYELMCKIVEYLNKVIEQQNITGERVDVLLNWFNNLDVQDEINNKLDVMAESGELQEIISEYLNSKAIFGFDNVESMKNATNLIDGSYAKTLGYYTKNDGGSGLYKIRTITNNDVVNEETIIALNDNTLIAELIIDISINPIVFGCKGNGINDDTEKLQDVINYAINNKVTLLSRKSKTYKITNTITIDGIIQANFENSEINANFNDDIIKITVTDNQGYDEDKEIYWSYGGFLKNLIINGNNNGIGIKFNGQKKFTLENIEIINCNTGLYVGSSTESIFNTIRFQKCNTGLYNSGSDAIFENIFGRFCNVGMELQSYTQIINSHFWVREDEDEFIDSIYAKIYSGARLENVQIDTYKTGIKLLGTGSYPLMMSGLWQQPNNSTNEYLLFDVTSGSFNNTGGSIRLHNFTATCKETQPYAKFSNVETNNFSGFIDYNTCRFLRVQKFPLTTHTQLTDITSKLEVSQNRVDIDGNKIHVTLLAKVLTPFHYETIAKLPIIENGWVPIVGKAFVGITSSQYSISNTEKLFGVFVSRNGNLILASQDGTNDIPANKYISIDFEYVAESLKNLSE